MYRVTPILQFISTHSLTRRLTVAAFFFCCPKVYFNSQPHKEADHGRPVSILIYRYFNSQPHKEADSSTTNWTTLRGYFNSQPHKEADGSLLYAAYGRRISTHSLTRRLTAKRSKDAYDMAFQLTASQGG